jgi:hypothetical protein
MGGGYVQRTLKVRCTCGEGKGWRGWWWAWRKWESGGVGAPVWVYFSTNVLVSQVQIEDRCEGKNGSGGCCEPTGLRGKIRCRAEAPALPHYIRDWLTSRLTATLSRLLCGILNQPISLLFESPS